MCSRDKKTKANRSSCLKVSKWTNNIFYWCKFIFHRAFANDSLKKTIRTLWNGLRNTIRLKWGLKGLSLGDLNELEKSKKDFGKSKKFELNQFICRFLAFWRKDIKAACLSVHMLQPYNSWTNFFSAIRDVTYFKFCSAILTLKMIGVKLKSLTGSVRRGGWISLKF